MNQGSISYEQSRRGHNYVGQFSASSGSVLSNTSCVARKAMGAEDLDAKFQHETERIVAQLRSIKKSVADASDPCVCVGGQIARTALHTRLFVPLKPWSELHGRSQAALRRQRARRA
jgi:hypothetical protein